MPTKEHDYAKIIAKAWSDNKFRERLIADPHAALKSEGWTLPPTVKFKVKENANEHEFVLALPKKPEGLSEQELIKKSEYFVCLICFC